jgi:hypothetical protein
MRQVAVSEAPDFVSKTGRTFKGVMIYTRSDGLRDDMCWVRISKSALYVSCRIGWLWFERKKTTVRFIHTRRQINVDDSGTRIYFKDQNEYEAAKRLLRNWNH